MQTLKLNPELIKDLKRTAKKKKVSFNSYCESILLVHHFTNGDTANIFNQLKMINKNEVKEKHQLRQSISKAS